MNAAPFVRVDHVVIAVRDLDAAAHAYADMLGLAPSWRGTHPAYGTANVLFGLRDCYLELLAPGDGDPKHPVAELVVAHLGARAESLFALALGSDDLHTTAAILRKAGLTPSESADGKGRDATGKTRRWRSFILPPADSRGVTVLAIQHTPDSTLAPAEPTAGADSVATAVDHVVMFSDDLAGALAFWHDTLGLTERWRRDFPDRGTVNVGLRLGGVTLELVAPLTPAGASEHRERLWGVAYRVGDCDAAVARLRAAGVAASDARTGIAPGTRVATVKWSERVPTLLVAKRERRAAE